MPNRQPINHPDNPEFMLVPLTKGYFSIIDIIDENIVSNYIWHVSIRDNGRQIYARRDLRKHEGDGVQYLHELIALQKGINLEVEIDHIDNNGLNNIRSNLRKSNKSQNQHNKRKSIKNKSGIKGVHWDPINERWIAKVMVNKKSKHLGRFDTLEEAKAVIEKERIRLHGEFTNNG